MYLLISDANILIDLEEGQLLEIFFNLPYQFKVPDVLFHEELSEHDIELLSEADELNNGAMALSAYGKLQFTQMSDYERAELEAALLKYCELDTLAMVMIYQGWLDMLKSK
ncbi:hypothetical protein [Rheinheimera sp. D18]|uniref:hypothetical protein n=1 Tax=Rheinheimera sp. D18 TaxID=2545632 RepID=UPI001A9E220F|nr:hypothetical protein [Rheinheimera sp. D18]